MSILRRQKGFTGIHKFVKKDFTGIHKFADFLSMGLTFPYPYLV